MYTLDNFPFAPGETLQVRHENGHVSDHDVPRMPMAREQFLDLVNKGNYTILTPTPEKETGEDDEGLGGDEDVPSGTIDEVLAWVGDNPTRAAQAIAAEAAGKNRTSLAARLTEILSDDGD